MIYTRKKDLNQILQTLEGERNIFIVGCADCATTCATGGIPQVKEMVQCLEQHNHHVTGFEVLEVPCDKRIDRQFLNRNEEILKGTDAILILSCGSGANTLAEISPIKVRTGLDSEFLGSTERLGDFREYCSHCGSCLINESEAVCTTTRCSKGLVNGPCGGALGDRCEVDPERVCIWIQLYKKNPKAPVFRQIIKPREKSKSRRPQTSKKNKGEE
jgi:ferredoxin